MKTVETTFEIAYTDDQYKDAREYVLDMKNHPKRVYWRGKEGKSDEELILSQIAHRILSGFYNNYDPTFASRSIVSMTNHSSWSIWFNTFLIIELITRFGFLEKLFLMRLAKIALILITSCPNMRPKA